MNISIIGTGYVGLVTAACFAETGNDVCCVDIEPAVVKQLEQGKIHIYEPGLEPLVHRNMEARRLRFTTDIEKAIEKAMFVFICVGTPANPDGSCDLRFVKNAASEIGRLINGYKIIVNKSTVPVGTAEAVQRIIRSEIERREVDVDFSVVSNPEFLKEGDAVNDFMRPDRIVIGADDQRAVELMKSLYGPFARARDKVIIMDVKSAEVTKYAANCMLATKISFMNEFANICENVGANIMHVRAGIGADRRIGFQFIYPGVGYGGSCFPKDVRAMINTAGASGVEPALISAVDAVNVRQKNILTRKIIQYFEEDGAVQGKTVAVWGLSFKPNTDDVRESAALEIIDALTERGVNIHAFDPAANENARKHLADTRRVTFFKDQYEPLQNADALAVVTDWNQFKNPDFDRIRQLLSAPVIFDGRNLYAPAFLKSEGFNYFSIGRAPVRTV